jgi:hypothetical protein
MFCIWIIMRKMKSQDYDAKKYKGISYMKEEI